MTKGDDPTPEPELATPLRRGWTTGACAAAAVRSAYEALMTGQHPAVVAIELPNGSRPTFAVTIFHNDGKHAAAGVVKDAGDDPDVTHGAVVIATVSFGARDTGIVFKAGEGVGTVTRPGLALAPGEPAINPVPRQMIRNTLTEARALFGGSEDVVVEISVPGGEALALKTLNGRLGIVGGLSILGTTGIVVPYSCAAWIDSIHRGIDVARAIGLTHIAGSTGSQSEAAVQKLYGLPETALIEMGDFAGGMLKYLRRHPLPRVTIAGGFAKMTKLGQGMLDLHSKRGGVDMAWLSLQLTKAGADHGFAQRALSANTASLVLDEARAAGLALGDVVADAAWKTAQRALVGSETDLDVVVFDRGGALCGRAGPRPV